VNFRSDIPKAGSAGVVALDSDDPEGRWIPVDLDAIEPAGAAESGSVDEAPPVVVQPAAVEEAEPTRETARAPQPHFAERRPGLGMPVTTAQLHGWLERLRPTDEALLSFERPPIRGGAFEPAPQRRIPETDIVSVGRPKRRARDETPGFAAMRSRAEDQAEAAAEPASGDAAPGASRRRKVLLGLALLIALTGALQAVMRMKQGPVPPAIVDELTL
jgi:hypothetical protein